VLLVGMTGPTLGQPSSATPSNERVAEPASIGRDEAVARVRAKDPLFADLPDYEALEKKSAASFSWAALLASGYVRVLPTLQNDLADLGGVDFRYPSGWLIETTLVTDCADLPDGTVVTDPCAWRHTWIHHVSVDGDVVTLTDSGDPEPMPSPEGIVP
jgi:hypothetical protein